MSDIDYRSTISYLFGLQKLGIKFGLENITKLVAFLGDPQLRYPCIHVAGTNGKGSTSSFIASILKEAGYRTGLYTSPHLLDFSERIKINGEPIPARLVGEYTTLMRPEIGILNATFFEATTAMAFKYFADQRVDLAVIETGLGGRLDSTNILEPVLSIITNIDIEHTEFLGNTIAEIAAEKAGIIKQGIPLLTGESDAEALKVFKNICNEKATYLFDPAYRTDHFRIVDLDLMEVRFRNSDSVYVSPLVGQHQTMNIGLALSAADMLLQAGFSGITDQAKALGIHNVKTNTGLTGRLDRIQRSPEIVLDVAHNPAGISALFSTWLQVRKAEHTHLVFGLLRTKDASGIVGILRRYPWKSIRLVQADSSEARPVTELLEVFEAGGVRASVSMKSGYDDEKSQSTRLDAVARDAVVICFDGTITAHFSVKEGVRAAVSFSEPGESVLVFGSHYVAAEVLKEIK